MAQQSFLPEDYLERRLQWRTNIIMLTLFAVVMVGLVAAFYVTDQARSDVRTRQQQVNADFQKAAAALQRLDELQHRKDEMIRKADLAGVLIEKVPRSLILSELVNSMPASMTLTDLELETSVQRPSLMGKSDLERIKAARASGREATGQPEVIPTQVTLQVSGLAPTDLDVAQFMSALRECELFGEPDLPLSEETFVEDRRMRKFRIDVALNQNISLIKYQPKKIARGLKMNPMATPTGEPDVKTILLQERGNKPAKGTGPGR